MTYESLCKLIIIILQITWTNIYYLQLFKNSVMLPYIDQIYKYKLGTTNEIFNILLILYQSVN